MEKNSQNIRQKTASNFAWRFLERVLAQLISFIVSIVLARILEPSAFGTVALITVFTNILQVFVDSGMANALIQKKNADNTDFSTVFFFNIFWCLLLYTILFFSAPLIAEFYNQDTLTNLIRVLGLTIVISGVKNVQQAYVSRTLQFRKFFWSTLGGTIFSAILGIGMAINGCGVWSIVGQYLSNLFIDTVILWITVKWRPNRVFSIARLMGLFSFGWKLLASGLIDTVYQNIIQLIIGKVYTSEDLAFYNRGSKFPNVIISNVNSSLDSVLLPVLANAQDNREQVKAMTRRSIKVAVYVMAPLMMGLLFTSEIVVRIVLTDKWLPCVPFLRIFCITYTFMPIHTSNLNAIKAMGRSDIFLKLEIIKKLIGICTILITVRISVMAMAYSLLFTNVASQIINSWPNRKLLNYNYSSQLKDILPSIILAVFMGLCVYPLVYVPISIYIVLPLQIILGAGVYLLGSMIFKLEEYSYFKSIICSFLTRKKGHEH